MVKGSSASGQYEFEEVLNFRDLGGYAASSGRTLARRRIFRSGGLWLATGSDVDRLKNQIRLKSILDLRDKAQMDSQGIGHVSSAGFRWYNVPLEGGSGVNMDMKILATLSNCGEVYLLYVRQPEYGKSVLNALGIIADPANHPLVFHCSAGKDRTGVLAAILLSIMGVTDEHIVNDYSLTAPYMKRHIARLSVNPEDAKFLQSLPDYMHEASPVSMRVFLSALKRDYGSVREYVKAQGADNSLFQRLEEALLI
jgi:protein-tyrosine phosphatase